MGIQVSAAQAAWLTHRNERVVRGWIKAGKLHAAPAGPRQPQESAQGRTGPSRWAIDTDALAQVPGVRLDPERMAELSASAPTVQATLQRRVEALERTVADLRAQVRRLTTQPASEQGPDEPRISPQEGAGWSEAGRQGNGGDAPSAGRGDPVARAGDAFTSAYGEWQPRPKPLTVALADRGSGGALPFKTKADAGRWLERHGINHLTPKTWQGWPPRDLLPETVLRDALSRQDPTNWRINWRLTRCTDAACVCHDMLAE